MSNCTHFRCCIKKESRSARLFLRGELIRLNIPHRPACFLFPVNSRVSLRCVLCVCDSPVCSYQLRQSQLELQEVRVSHRQLSARLEELTEERSLQSFSPNPHSLLCEIEQSMEQEELEQEREQVCHYNSVQTAPHHRFFWTGDTYSHDLLFA